MELTKLIILDRIAKEGNFLKICRKISRNDSLCDDLYQECLLVLLEKDDSKIIDLYIKNELQPFFIRIVQNTFNSKTSQFYKKYKSNIIPIESKGIDLDSEYDYDKIIEYVQSGECPRSEMFENKIITALMLDSGIRNLERKTGINRRTITNAIQRFKDKINGSEEFKRKSI